MGDEVVMGVSFDGEVVEIRGKHYEVFSPGDFGRCFLSKRSVYCCRIIERIYITLQSQMRSCLRARNLEEAHILFQKSEPEYVNRRCDFTTAMLASSLL